MIFLIEQSCQESPIIEGITSFFIKQWYPFKKVFTFEGEAHEESSGTILELPGPVICYGSVSLNKVALKHNWLPGCFYSPNHSVIQYIENYKQNYLNYYSVICKLYEVDYKNLPEFFIRPLTDQKQFNGKVYSGALFEGWFQRYTKCNEDLKYVPPNTLVLVAASQDIAEEYRFFVVKNKIVAHSLYRQNGKLISNPEVPKAALSFADTMINKVWSPCESFVIDIALLGNGQYRVIETNQLGCSGLYACNYEAIFSALYKAYSSPETK